VADPVEGVADRSTGEVVAAAELDQVPVRTDATGLADADGPAVVLLFDNTAALPSGQLPCSDFDVMGGTGGGSDTPGRGADHFEQDRATGGPVDVDPVADVDLGADRQVDDVLIEADLSTVGVFEPEALVRVARNARHDRLRGLHVARRRHGVGPVADIRPEAQERRVEAHPRMNPSASG
jgi:hypothetical protein